MITKNINDNLEYSFRDTVCCRIAHKPNNIFNNKSNYWALDMAAMNSLFSLKDIPSKRNMFHKASIILEKNFIFVLIKLCKNIRSTFNWYYALLALMTVKHYNCLNKPILLSISKNWGKSRILLLMITIRI